MRKRKKINAGCERVSQCSLVLGKRDQDPMGKVGQVQHSQTRPPSSSTTTTTSNHNRNRNTNTKNTKNTDTNNTNTTTPTPQHQHHHPHHPHPQFNEPQTTPSQRVETAMAAGARDDTSRASSMFFILFCFLHYIFIITLMIIF